MSYCNDAQRLEHEKELKRLEGMTVEQLQVVLDERLKESLIEAIQKLPQRIDSHLDNAAWNIITASLGVVKDTWHDSKWEISDKHNKAALALELGEHALAQIKHAIPGFVEGIVAGDPRIPPIKSAYLRSYKQKLAELVDRKIWEIAETNANKRFVEIMEKIGGETVDLEDAEE